jgi:hypothetical protein
VLVDHVRLPLAFRQYHTPDLTGWAGDPSDSRLQPLLSAIQAIVPASEEKPSPEVIDKGDIFLSYARTDQAYVRKLMEYLRGHGLSVWADDRIDYGDRWWRTIVANLRNCVALVVVMTPDSEKSKWVEGEIMFADELEKPIYPILLKGSRFPLLIGMQYHDVTDRSMPPSDFVDALRRASGEASPGTQRNARDQVQRTRGRSFWQRLVGVFRE